MLDMEPLVPVLTLLLSLVSDQARVRKPARKLGRLELAGPGIQGILAEGELVVYRTARSRAESEAVLAAVRRFRPGQAFQASRAINMDIVGHSQLPRVFATAERRGQEPLFTTPYPTTAYFYTDHKAEEPVTYALVIPKSAVLWENSRTYRTQGIFYSLTYPDSELIIDARQVRKVLLVPPDLLQQIGEATNELAAENILQGGFKMAFKDRDEALAATAADAVVDLRVPPRNLGRPFKESPLELPGVGGVSQGQRVLLKDGQVVTLKAVRCTRWMSLGPSQGRWETLKLGDPGCFEPGSKMVFETTRPSVAWVAEPTGSTWDPLLSQLNMSWELISRPVQKGERVKIAERRRAWSEGRTELRAVLRQEQVRLEKAMAQRPNAQIAEGLRVIEAAIEKTTSSTPPWA